MDFDIDSFDNYLDGKLNAEDSAAFEQSLASDMVLAKEFELHKTARNVVIRAAKAREIRLATKEHLHQEGFFEQFQYPKRPISGPNLWAWAACILFVLLAAGTFWHCRQMKIEKEKREQEHREKLRVEMSQSSLLAENKQLKSQLDTKRLDGTLDSSFDISDYVEKLSLAQSENKIMRKEIARIFARQHQHANELQGNNDIDNLPEKAYKAGKYAEAIRLWQNNPPQTTVERESDMYWLPYAYFNENMFDEASKAFVELKRINRFKTKEVDYYLLLCYYAEGRDKDARSMLKTILAFGSEQYNPYYDEAKAMEPLLRIKQQ